MRDHVWRVERLAACGKPIRHMPVGLAVSHRPSRVRHLLVISPDRNLRQILSKNWGVAHNLDIAGANDQTGRDIYDQYRPSPRTA